MNWTLDFDIIVPLLLSNIIFIRNIFFVHVWVWLLDKEASWAVNEKLTFKTHMWNLDFRTLLLKTLGNKNKNIMDISVSSISLAILSNEWFASYLDLIWNIYSEKRKENMVYKFDKTIKSNCFFFIQDTASNLPVLYSIDAVSASFKGWCTRHSFGKIKFSAWYIFPDTLRHMKLKLSAFLLGHQDI